MNRFRSRPSRPGGGRVRAPFVLAVPALLAVAFLLMPLVGVLARTEWGQLGDHLSSPGVTEALKLSLVVSFWTLGLSLLLGVPLAWLLAQRRGFTIGEDVFVAHVPERIAVDDQESGPFKYFRHEHDFERVDEKTTRLSDHLTYRVGYGPIGWVANLVLVRRELTELFRFRHAKTREAFAAKFERPDATLERLARVLESMTEGVSVVDEARDAVVAALREEGLISGTRPYEHDVPHSHRSGRRVEPLISLQWFCDMTDFANPAFAAA